MALTQISTGGVKDDAVTAGKIPADAVGQSEIADEAVDEARLQVSNAGSNGQFLSKQSGNTGGLTWATPTDTVYTHPNHSGEVTSSADGATVIASNIVDEDNLKISNAGTNGQYLQKQSGNTGGLTWADVTIPPAGNTFTAVADGAIATNKPVCCVSSGKVAEIKLSDTATSTMENSADCTLVTSEGMGDATNVIAWDPDNDILLVVYIQSSGPPHNLRYHIWKNSTSDTSFTQQGSGGDINTNNIENVSLCWLSSNRFVLTYYEQTNSKSVIQVGTLGNLGSTPTITWGDKYDLDGQGSREYISNKICKIGANRVAIACRAAANGRWTSGKPGIIIGDITNDDEWTYRNSEQLSTLDLTQQTLNYGHHFLEYNSTDDNILVGLRNDNDTSDLIAVKVASGDSATITKSSSLTQLYNGESTQLVGVYHSGSNKYVVAYENDGDSDIDTLTVDVNDSTLAITKGSVVTIAEHPNSSGLALGVSGVGGLYCAYITANNIKIRNDHDFSGAIGWGGQQGNNNAPSSKCEWMNGDNVIFTENNKRMVVFFSESGHAGSDARKGRLTSFQTVESASNLTTTGNVPVGWVDSAYSDGNTVTVKTVGNTQTGFSGLTPGTKYYIQGNGTIATSADSALNAQWGSLKPVAGTAIKSDTLLISSAHSQ